MSFIVIFSTIILVLIGGYILVDYLLLRRGIDFTGRMKHLVMGILFIALSIAGAYVGYHETAELFELATNGRETVGKVIETKKEIRHRRRRTHILYLNTVDYDGHKRVFELDQEYPLGTQFYLVYSNSSPEIARVSRMRQGFLAFLLSEHGWWEIIFSVSLPVVLLVMGIRSIRILFLPRKVFDAVEKEK